MSLKQLLTMLKKENLLLLQLSVLVEARELLPFASLRNLEQVFTVRFTKIQLKM